MMNGPLLLSILSAVLPLTVAAPNHGHAHAQMHRDIHDSLPRDQGHSHGHSHRNVHEGLAVPAIKARGSSPASSGCGRKPKGKGKGNANTGSTGSSSDVGGVFFPSSSSGAVAASPANTPLDTSEANTPTDVVPSGTSTTTVSITSTLTSTLDVHATSDAVVAAAAVAATTSASVLEAFQKSHTLTTSYSAAQATTSTSATKTSSVGAEAGSGSGSGGYSDSAPVPTGDADNLTVLVRNMMKYDLTTSHGMNNGLPAHVQAITATLTDGTMAAGATGLMIYPSGWAGMIVVAKVATEDDEVVDLANGSLLEGSFLDQMGDTPVGDLDVSYVSGYTVPITCTCQNPDEQAVNFGCSVDLFTDGTGSGLCPDTCFGGSTSCLVGATCNNPLRALDEPDLDPAQFFKRCEGTAFTYAQDTANSQNSQCTSNYVSCCIGTHEDGCIDWSAANSTSSAS